MISTVSKSKWARAGSGQEEGFLLLGVLFMILLLMIALAVAAPKIADSIRRDKEEETIHRGKQYARAVQMYYNKFGRYPNTIDQLVKTNDQRFLRKRYLDPMTGKDDWRIIHNGEQKVPSMGLFGQSVQQNGITPTGASTGIGTGNTSSIGASSPFGSSAGSPGTSANNGSSSFGSSGSGFGSSGSSFTSGSSSSPFGNNGSTSPIGGTASGSSGGFGSSTGIGGTTTNGATNNIGGVQTTGGSSSAFGSPGVSVGGAPIVGVGLTDKRTSIKVYRKQTHYNQWEFVFDPNQMALDAMAGGVAGGNINGASAGTGPNGVNSGGFNSGTGGFNSGNGSGFGSNSGSGFGSNSGSGFGSSSGSGFGSNNNSNNGSGFGSPTSNPTSPAPPANNTPQ